MKYPNLFDYGMPMFRLILLTFFIFPACSYASPIDWSPAVTLSTPEMNASDPQIEIDGSGNLVAMWLEGGFVASKHKLVDGEWSASINILSEQGATSPKLTVDLDGNASALWIEKGIVKTSFMPFKGTWETPTTISISGTAAQPQITCDSSGNVAAIWVVSNIVQASIKLSNSSWQPTPDILSSFGSSSPQISIGGNGQIFAIWSGISTGSSQIYTCNKPLAGNWSSPEIISPASKNNIIPLISVDLSGNAVTAWLNYEGTQIYQSKLRIQTAMKPINEDWRLTRETDAGLFNPVNLYGSMFYDPHGNAVAVWETTRNGSIFSINASTKYVGCDWDDPYVFNLGLYCFSANVAITSLGNMYVVYMNNTTDGDCFVIQETQSNIFSSAKDIWSTPQVISAGCSNGYPTVTAASLGNNTNEIAVIWLKKSNESYNSIEVSVGIQQNILPPTNLQVIQSSNNFTAYTEYYNTLSWTPSSSIGVNYYLIYRNGFSVDIVSNSAVQWIDHNRVPMGPVTYGIIAVDRDNMQSPMATISYP